MKNTSIKFSTLLLSVSALILLGVMVKILSRPASLSPTGSAVLNANAQALKATLAVSTNPTEQAFINSKLELLNNMQANSLQGQVNPAEKSSSVCAFEPTSLPAVGHSPGIEQLQPDVLYQEFDADVFSRWHGEINGQWATVMAGARLTDPPQPTLWVFIENTADSGIYPAVNASGALHILSADQSRLTLRDDAGATFYFDAAARAYLTDPGAILPTLAPQPTFTPEAAVCAP